MNFPKGFFCNGIHCGIKKNGKNDLSVFYSEKPCTAAGKYTRNIFKAAPVIVSARNINNKIHAIIANSGGANACTGDRGIRDSEKMCEITANALNTRPVRTAEGGLISNGVKSKNVLVASTGVIGQYLPMSKVTTGIKSLTRSLAQSLNYSPLSAVKGIMTTDTFPKIASKRFLLSSIPLRQRSGASVPLPSSLVPVSIWGCAKGSGMIEPNLATMLSFILTDVNITKQALNRALKIAVEKSFNCLTVDGDTSTNDTVFLLANGEGRNKIISGGKSFELFSNELTNICIKLAKMLASDGEGATKLITVNVTGAKTHTDAGKIAKTVANSPLVKTAVYGNDANWGRIVAAVGRSGVIVNPEKLEISFGGLCVFKNSKPADFSEKKAKNIISKKEVSININLKAGSAAATVYTCDFTKGYIDINASYRS